MGYLQFTQVATAWVGALASKCLHYCSPSNPIAPLRAAMTQQCQRSTDLVNTSDLRPKATGAATDRFPVSSILL